LHRSSQLLRFENLHRAPQHAKPSL
jgi:hypothetical protein